MGENNEFKKFARAELAELQCTLLEFVPDAKIAVFFKVSETCTLVYTVEKQ